MAELAHPTSFWALCNVCLGPRSLQEIAVVVKEALALCLTLRDQAVGRSGGKELLDVADSSVTSQTRMKKRQQQRESQMTRK